MITVKNKKRKKKDGAWIKNLAQSASVKWEMNWMWAEWMGTYFVSHLFKQYVPLIYSRLVFMLINNSLFFLGTGLSGWPLVSLHVWWPPSRSAPKLCSFFFFFFFVLIFAHFQYVLIDIWISQRVSRQDASTLPPFFFFFQFPLSMNL